MKSPMMRLALFAALLLSASLALADDPRILVFTRNGPTLDGKKGFVHDNIPASIEMLRKLGKENHITVDVTEDPAAFSLDNLKKYKAIVFSNSNNQVLDNEDQQKAFQDYIHAGGGFVGIHSASGSMRKWPWFWALLGGTFQRHPPLQKFTIKVVDKSHPSTSFLGETWAWEDEFYFHKDLAKDLHILLAGDLTTLNDKAKPQTPDNTYPLAWCHEFEGGRAFFTALGHKSAYYADPKFQKHVLGGILYAMGDKK